MFVLAFVVVVGLGYAHRLLLSDLPPDFGPRIMRVRPMPAA
jgi:hypothetical protein